MTSEPAATVHLRLRGHLTDDAVAGLREQLTACAASGVPRVVVHLEEQADLDLTVLLALDTGRRLVVRAGGTLSVLGAGPRVVTKLKIHGLTELLATRADASLENGAGRARTGSA